MKTSRRIILGVSCLTVAACLVAATPRPQDPVTAAPGNVRVLLENDRVRVLDFHAKAGEKIPMHSHLAYVSYYDFGQRKNKIHRSRRQGDGAGGARGRGALA